MFVGEIVRRLQRCVAGWCGGCDPDLGPSSPLYSLSLSIYLDLLSLVGWFVSREGGPCVRACVRVMTWTGRGGRRRTAAAAGRFADAYSFRRSLDRD